MTNEAQKKGQDEGSSTPGKLPTGDKESTKEKERKRDKDSK